MNLRILKTIFSIAGLMTMFACSQSKGDAPSAPDLLSAASLKSTTLQSRSKAGETDNYPQATFSFQYMTHDQKITNNDYDIEFSGSKISTVQVVDQIGMIADLGATSCQDIKNSYEQTGPYPGKGHGGYPYKQDRSLDPMFWFEYSSAMDALQTTTFSSEINVEVGHCYVVNKVTNQRHVIAVFHVQDLIPDQSVTIDEIEVFERKTF